MAKKIATLGILTALTLILSYVERLIPFGLSVPGIKPGFANIGVLVTLYTFGGVSAAVVSLLRVVIAGLLFSGASGMIYSLCGAVCALVVMLIMKRVRVFGVVGVSAGGALAHIVGQLAVASALLGGAVWVYMPWLLLISMLTGVFNGAVSAMVVQRLAKIKNLW